MSTQIYIPRLGQTVTVDDEVANDVLRTQNRAEWVLPDAWWEPGVAERMCEWIKRTAFVSEAAA